MHGVGCDPLRDAHGGGVAPFGPLFRATSRDTVDTDRPSSPAIAVSVFFWARPREIVSRSPSTTATAAVVARPGAARLPIGSTSSARSSSTLQPPRLPDSTSPRSTGQ
jgi:hypothetical protein